MHLQQELTQRGFVNQYSDKKLFDLYDQGGQKFYCGFDPTADSLHLGNFVMFMSAVNFMKRGNTFYLILGGATGMIGDPGGKDAERSFLSEEQIAHNIAALQIQVQTILDNIKNLTGEDIPLKFTIINNADFYQNMHFLTFLREVGKNITVNTMINKETVKKRIEDPSKSISYTEFSYMLIQGYDFMHLFDQHGVAMQICGSDQRGNGVTGIELIRKKLNKESYVFTSPLLLDSNGKKFGKSEGNAIRLDPKKNSPYFVYQYFMNTTDEDIVRYFKIFSLLSFDQIDAIINKHNENPGARSGQQALSHYIVSIIFGKQAADQSKKISDLLFGKGDKMDVVAGLSDSETLAVKQEIGGIITDNISTISNILEVCVQTALTSSKGEAKKMIQQGAIYLNEQKVTDQNYQLSINDQINNTILLRKGKKSYKIVVIEE